MDISNIGSRIDCKIRLTTIIRTRTSYRFKFNVNNYVPIISVIRVIIMVLNTICKLRIHPLR